MVVEPQPTENATLVTDRVEGVTDALAERVRLEVVSLAPSLGATKLALMTGVAGGAVSPGQPVPGLPEV